MNRRKFISSSALALPLTTAGLVACTGKTSLSLPENEIIIEKAIKAMLCMARMAWEQGTASQALIAAGKKDLVILFAKDAIVRQTDEGRLGVLYSDAGITDPAANGESVLFAWEQTGDDQYKKAADDMYRYLKQIAPKTEDGILHHTTSAPQVWSDTAFMAPPFLAMMNDFEEAVKQIEGMRKYLFDPEKKLYYHMWDEGKKDFARKLFWGGGNGWTAAGIAKILDVLPDDQTDFRNRLSHYAKEVIDGCIAFMRSDGLFHDIIDDSNSFVETNLGQMLSFSIYKGIKAGWLDENYRAKADLMRKAAHAQLDAYGIIQGACGAPYFDKPGTSVEAQAFFILMEYAWKSLQ